VHEAYLVASSGLQVDLAVKRPVERAGSGQPSGGHGAGPLVLILGGHRTGSEAVHLIRDTRGTVVAALSYPSRLDPEADGLSVALAAPAIRAAALDTPPALMLALDYLLALPYVDPSRVELVGVSLGAPFVCIAGALDPRVTRVWSIHGAGDPLSLLEFNLRDRIHASPLRAVAAGAAYLILGGPRLAPEKWVARIAPRPFVMINARDDERLPRDAVLRLYANALEPKEILWTSGAHVGPRQAQAIEAIANLVLDRVAASGG
jgi:dienelactone hydrolase